MLLRCPSSSARIYQNGYLKTVIKDSTEEKLKKKGWFVCILENVSENRFIKPHVLIYLLEFQKRWHRSPSWISPVPLPSER